jgi:single-strand DNA-binding protein
MQGTMQLLGGRPDNAGGGQQRPAPQREPQREQQQAPRPAPQPQAKPAQDFDSFDDDIPF